MEGGLEVLQINQYHKATSLDEAMELLSKNRMNQIIGGMMWLRMQDRTIPVAIDLCDLGLDSIEETEEGFLIGAMTTLRTLETHTGLKQYFGTLFQDAVKDIVGVQFRNTATVGGSLYSRFGFSDILCAFLCLNAEVHLHKQGKVSIEEYAKMGYERDILTHIFVRKEDIKTAFACVRKSATDLPVLNMSIAKNNDELRLVVGSRPKRAMLLKKAWTNDFEFLAKEMAETVPCEDNMRGSKEYREKLVYALTLRLLKQVSEEEVA